jgi:hypothetical protein
VNLDRLALAVGVDVVVFALGLAAVAPIVAVVLLGERRAGHAPGRARADDDAAGGVAGRPREHHRDLAVLTSVIINSATTTVVVAASAAPRLPMKAADRPPSHSPRMPPGPCDEKPLSANGR